MQVVAFAALSAASPPSTGGFVPLSLVGLGRYGASPALYLEKERGGKVLPVPIPRESVLACEQALSPRTPAMAEVLLQCRSFARRDGGLLDQLPWQWNPSELAKRDGAARLSGRDYPQQSARRPESPYHLLLSAVQSDARADVSRVLLAAERDAESDGVVVGGRLMLVRRLPESTGALTTGDARRAQRGDDEVDPSDEQGREVPCGCTVDEALGLAIALRCEVQVESAVWEAAARAPRYTLQRDMLRISLPEQDDDDDTAEGAASPRVRLAGLLSRGARAPPPRLPWEWETAEELRAASLLDVALSALAAGLELPRAAEATAGALIARIEPLLDAQVRRDLRVARAFEEGVIDANERFALEASLARRERLLRRVGVAAAAAAYGEAARVQVELRQETEYLDELLDAMTRPAFAPDAERPSSSRSLPSSLSLSMRTTDDLQRPPPQQKQQQQRQQRQQRQQQQQQQGPWQQQQPPRPLRGANAPNRDDVISAAAAASVASAAAAAAAEHEAMWETRPIFGRRPSGAHVADWPRMADARGCRGPDSAVAGAAWRPK